MKRKVPVYLLLLGCVLPIFSQGFINNCNPSNGYIGQSLSVSITGIGTNFNAATGVALQKGNQNLMATSFTVNSATDITAQFNIPSSGFVGDMTVSTFANSAPQINGFYVSPPAILSVAQDSAWVGESFTMTLTATPGVIATTNAVALTRFGNSNQPIYATTINVTSATTLEAQFQIPSGTNWGNWNVTTFPNNLQLYNGFHVKLTPPPGTDGRISGRFYWDRFNDLSYSSTFDSPHANKVVTFMPGNYTALTNASGVYELYLPMGTYTVSVQNPNPSSQSFSQPATGTRTVTINSFGQFITNQDFRTFSPIYRDNAVFITTNAARPGFTHNVSVIGRNQSTQPDDMTIKLVHDSTLTLGTTNITPTSYIGDTITWDFTNVGQGGSRTVTASFVVPTIPNVLLGQNLTHSATISPTTGDQDLTNNSATTTRIITGSYDPNDKQSYPLACGNDGITNPNDSLLTYFIRFQNTGTDTAFNIRVRDTLDPDLDWSTFQTIGSSHSYQMTMGPQGEVDWFFPNILLLDSNRSEPLSHGFILFTIETESGLPIGTKVENTAHIYFDFNPAIVTNTTLNTIDTAFCSFAGVEQYLCTGDSAYLTGFLPLLSNGTWSVLNGSGTFTDPNDPNSKVTGMSVGTNEFIWTITNGSITVRDTTSINITGPPSANAGPDQSICTNSMVQLAGTGNGIGAWSFVSGSGVFSDPHDPNATVSNLANGLNQIVWTVDAGTCQDQDTVNIQLLGGFAGISAGNDTTVCQNSTFLLNGEDPGAGTGTWSVLSGSGTLTNAADPHSGITVSSVGTVSLEWAVNYGSCLTSRDTVTVSVNALPTTANAGPDLTACLSDLSVALAGNTPISGQGNWYLVSGPGGTFISPTSPNSSFSFFFDGTYELMWNISTANCATSSDTVVLRVDAPPSVSSAGNDQTLCSANSTQFNANTPIIGTGQWMQTAGTATIITAPSDPQSAVTFVTNGSYEFEWTISNGICPPEADQVTLEVEITVPSVDAGPDQEVCDPAADLAATAPGSGDWSVIGGSGTFSNSTDPQANVSGLSPGNNVFLWNAPFVSNCSNQFTDTVSILYHVPMVPTVTQNGNTLTSSPAVSYQWNLNGNLLAGETSISISPIQSGSYTVTTVDTNGCEATSDVFVGREDFSAADNIEVFPQPARDQVFVRVKAQAPGELEIRLMDVSGRELSRQFFHHQDVTETELDLSEIAAGLYLVSIRVNGGTYMRKIIKE